MKKYLALLFYLQLCLLISCASKHVPLPTGTIESSYAEGLPLWTVGKTKKLCPADTVCFIGTSSKINGKRKAIKTARYDAYVQVAESAFPTDISHKYTKFRNSNGTKMQEEIASELVGRLEGVAILDSAWIKRNIFLMKGSSQVYDAWVLVSIKKSKLDTLYHREIARSKKESRLIYSDIQAELNLLQNKSTANDVSRIIKMIRSKREHLKQLQQTDESEQAGRALDKLKRELMSQLKLNVIATEIDMNSARSEINIELKTAGYVIPFTRLNIKSDCTANMKFVTSDQNGQARIYLIHSSRISACTLTVSSPCLKEDLQTITVDAPIGCVKPVYSFNIKGFQAKSIRHFLRLKKSQLKSNVQLQFQSCKKSVSDDEKIILAISVNGFIRKPKHKTRQLMQIGGNIEITLSLISNRKVIYTTKSDNNPFVIVDIGGARIVESVKQKLLEIIADKTKTMVGGL